MKTVGHDKGSFRAGRVSHCSGLKVDKQRENGDEKVTEGECGKFRGFFFSEDSKTSF